MRQWRGPCVRGTRSGPDRGMCEDGSGLGLSDDPGCVPGSCGCLVARTQAVRISRGSRCRTWSHTRPLPVGGQAVSCESGQ